MTEIEEMPRWSEAKDKGYKLMRKLVEEGIQKRERTHTSGERS